MSSLMLVIPITKLSEQLMTFSSDNNLLECSFFKEKHINLINRIPQRDFKV